MSDSAARACPCGSGHPLAVCCGPFIAGLGHAPTAEALMRSRYTAFTLNRATYLMNTWAPETRPEQVHLDHQTRWLGLDVRECVAGRPGDDQGTVEFVARSKRGGRARRLHERSRFRFQDGQWFYIDGERV